MQTRVYVRTYVCFNRLVLVESLDVVGPLLIQTISTYRNKHAIHGLPFTASHAATYSMSLRSITSHIAENQHLREKYKCV